MNIDIEMFEYKSWLMRKEKEEMEMNIERYWSSLAHDCEEINE